MEINQVSARGWLQVTQNNVDARKTKLVRTKLQHIWLNRSYYVDPSYLRNMRSISCPKVSDNASLTGQGLLLQESWLRGEDISLRQINHRGVAIASQIQPACYLCGFLIRNYQLPAMKRDHPAGLLAPRQFI